MISLVSFYEYKWYSWRHVKRPPTQNTPVPCQYNQVRVSMLYFRSYMLVAGTMRYLPNKKNINHANHTITTCINMMAFEREQPKIPIKTRS